MLTPLHVLNDDRNNGRRWLNLRALKDYGKACGQGKNDDDWHVFFDKEDMHVDYEVSRGSSSLEMGLHAARLHIFTLAKRCLEEREEVCSKMKEMRNAATTAQ